jgi:hypothetical protein
MLNASGNVLVKKTTAHHVVKINLNENIKICCPSKPGSNLRNQEAYTEKKM